MDLRCQRFRRTRYTWVERIFLRLCVMARSRIFPLSRTLESKPVTAQSLSSGRQCSIFTTYTATNSLEHYHKRSSVETTFSMIKAKFGHKLRSKSLTGQINEALCKVLCHNLCVVIQSVRELGIEAAFASEISPEVFLPHPSSRQR
jgi:hypothetical protein